MTNANNQANAIQLEKEINMSYEVRNNPSKYIKPLDIILACYKGSNNDMVHACVYLGSGKVCHVLGGGGGVVKIDDWSRFLSIIPADKILRYHPVVPFKRPHEIVRHIAKAIEGRRKYFAPGTKTRDGSFRIYSDCEGRSNNCENFTNVCVLGLNFSELSTRREADDDYLGGIPNFQVSVFLTRRNLDNLTNSSSVNDRIREINGYKNSVSYSQGIKMETRIEVQPKAQYRLK